MSHRIVDLTKSQFFTIFMLLAALILPLSAFAQDPDDDATRPYITPDGSFSFAYPDDWSLMVEGLDDFIFLSNGPYEESVFFDEEAKDSLVVLIVPPNNFAEVFPDVDELPRTPRELLELLIFDSNETNIFSEIEEGTLSGHRAVFANIDDSNLQGQVFVVDLDDADFVVLVAATVSGGSYSHHQETVLAIAASMTLHRYLPGDFRPIISTKMNLSFEMPAEFIYDDTDEAGVVFFGSTPDLIDSFEPSEGELLGLFASPQFLSEALDLQTPQFESPEQALALFSDTILVNQLEGVAFSDMERIELDDTPVAEIVQFTFESDTFDGVVMAFVLPDERVMVAVFVTSTGEFSAFEDTITQIVESIDVLNANAEITSGDG